MKKIFFLSAIVSIILLACNPLKPHSNAAVKAIFAGPDSIPASVAENMITHYLDTTLVDHRMGAIIRRIDLNNSDLYNFFQLKHITRLRLLTAAYLATDPIVSRRNKVTVLIQLKKGYHSDYYYYDGINLLCPPPNGCSTYDN
jgi:hypothetical protein